MIELLSPAKDLSVGISAINAGADAVYIGANKFSARRNAVNDLQSISDLCNYAHQFNAKVYVALNTLIKDTELCDAEKLAWDLYDSNVDALIVQDMGILEMNMPPISLHASTQCDIDSIDKAKFLEDAGFETIVLARELSLSQIEQIAKSVKAKVEVFVHGSLCVCKSGKCYLSYAIGDRSANRGECAQPCRMSYSLLDADLKKVAKDRYYLSLKDMNRSDYLADLINAGVSSLKIEGRLKDASYVKNVTKYYSDKLNLLIEKKLVETQRSSLGKVVKSPFDADLSRVFNRTFTSYNIDGKKGEAMSSFESPKSRGIYLGKINKVLSQNRFVVEGFADNIENGDGFFAIDAQGESYGFRVDKVENKIAYCRSEKAIEIGTKIWRNSSAKDDKLFALEFERKLNCTMSISTKDKEFVVSAECENKISVQVKSTFEEIANNAQESAARIIESLSKSGGTIYNVCKIENDMQVVPHLKASQINSIRRELFDLLTKQAIDKANVALKNKVAKPRTYPTNGEFFGDTNFELNVLNKNAEKFYQKCNVNTNEYAPEYGYAMDNKRLMQTMHCMLRELDLCKKKHSMGFKEPMYLSSQNKLLRLEFDCKNCNMNIYYGR